ncbi:hypothetical protein IWQ62_000880 [Dispira parvispora]|uniref:Pentatricopeptide repeat-containing protein n=1 Tax=Dispira parvispora TaxID=1520584 RepID=A0A9W8ATQ1_9FUNG|nr:hypothetical protein IWQ62_000880 [Dispira parvispora]
MLRQCLVGIAPCNTRISHTIQRPIGLLPFVAHTHAIPLALTHLVWAPWPNQPRQYGTDSTLTSTTQLAQQLARLNTVDRIDQHKQAGEWERVAQQAWERYTGRRSTLSDTDCQVLLQALVLPFRAAQLPSPTPHINQAVFPVYNVSTHILSYTIPAAPTVDRLVSILGHQCHISPLLSPATSTSVEETESMSQIESASGLDVEPMFGESQSAAECYILTTALVTLYQRLLSPQTEVSTHPSSASPAQPTNVQDIGSHNHDHWHRILVQAQKHLRRYKITSNQRTANIALFSALATRAPITVAELALGTDSSLVMVDTSQEYLLMLWTLVRLGQVDPAMELYRRCRDQQRIPLQPVVFRWLGYLCRQHRLASQAEELLYDLKASGLPLSPSFCAEYMATFALVGNTTRVQALYPIFGSNSPPMAWEEARGLLQALHDARELPRLLGIYKALRSQGSLPTDVVCLVIRAIGELGNASLLHEFERELGESQLKALTKSDDIKATLMYAYSLVEVTPLVDRYAQDLLRRFEQLSTPVCNTLLEALCHYNRFTKARRVYSRMIRRGVYPTARAWAVILETGMKYRNLGFTAKMFNELRHRSPVEWNHELYYQVVRYLFYVDRPMNALKQFDQMKTRHIQPNLAFYSMVAQNLHTLRWAPELKVLVDDMRNAGVHPSLDIYNLTIQLLYRTGDIAAVQEVIAYRAVTYPNYDGQEPFVPKPKRFTQPVRYEEYQ